MEPTKIKVMGVSDEGSSVVNQMIGCPKAIDNDLRCKEVPTSCSRIRPRTVLMIYR
uniref:Uncharacterized protein n=1 Tax=Vitis vinifera TaxID=29760 RepID=F6I2T0_VITVI